MFHISYSVTMKLLNSLLFNDQSFNASSQIFIPTWKYFDIQAKLNENCAKQKWLCVERQKKLTAANSTHSFGKTIVQREVLAPS